MAKSKKDAIIEKFNEKYAFVLEDSKPKIYVKSYDEELEREYYNSITTETLRQMYENTEYKYVDPDLGRTVIKSHAQVWLESPKRKQYLDGIVFDPNPNRKSNQNVLNLWKGLPEPKKGNWSWINDHIENIICAGNKEQIDYFTKWMAYCIQKPHLQSEVAVIVRGKKGCGKSVIGEFLTRIFGINGMQVNTPNHLTGKFNAHLRAIAFLFVNEAIWAGDKIAEQTLKNLITDDVITIEVKKGDITNRRNRLSIFMATNSDWIFPATKDERRAFVMDATDDYIGDKSYMTKLWKQSYSHEAAQAFLYDMMQIDLSDFNIRQYPSTDALNEQKVKSMESLEKWWLDCLVEEKIYESKYALEDFDEWREVVSTKILYESYIQFCNRMKLNSYHIKSKEELGKFFAQFCKITRPRLPVLIGEQPPQGGYAAVAIYSRLSQRPYCYEIGDLASARKVFSDFEKINYKFLELSSENENAI